MYCLNKKIHKLFIELLIAKVSDYLKIANRQATMQFKSVTCFILKSIKNTILNLKSK